MPRLLSVSHTLEAVEARTKDVTRRLGWWDDRNGRRLLHVGDKLTLCRKVMGRKPGEPLVKIIDVIVTGHERRPLLDGLLAHPGDVAREGFPDWSIDQFLWFYCPTFRVQPDTPVTRIEWRYLDPQPKENTQ